MNKALWSVTAFVFLLFSAAATADAQTTPRPRAQPIADPAVGADVGQPAAERMEHRKSVVYRVRNAPAIDVANAINKVLQAERQVRQLTPGLVSASDEVDREATVVPELISNSLIIAGTPPTIAETVRLIEQLDQPGGMVTVDVLIAEVLPKEGDDAQSAATPSGPGRDPREVRGWLRDLEKSGRLRVIARPQLTALSNQPAFLQLGRRVPRVTGISTGPAGQRAPATRGPAGQVAPPGPRGAAGSPAAAPTGAVAPVAPSLQTAEPVTRVTMENVGVIVSLRPRISPDGVVTMEVDVQKSQPRPSGEGAETGVSAAGASLRSPEIDILMVQTTVSVRDEIGRAHV
jgi:type II secretory pathway component GspD/PulD (secretin)